MPFWASWVIDGVVRLIIRYLQQKRAEQALRDLGAKTQAAASNAEAERQESLARAAGEKAAVALPDPNDPDLRD